MALFPIMLLASALSATASPAGPQSQSVIPPKLTQDPSPLLTCDVGPVQIGTVLHASVRITNHGDVPVQVYGPSPNATCIPSLVKRAEVPAGATAEISIRGLDTSGLRGPISKAQLLSFASAKPCELEVTMLCWVADP
jgi:hypothetical protein